MDAIIISGENGELGARFKEFTLAYTVTAEGEITVTETLGGTILRSYTAVSGEEQQAVIPVAGLTLGQHTVTITAAVGEETAERVYAFTVPTIWIDHERADLGNRVDSFAITYVPGCYSGEEVTVTEFLDGTQQRSYTTASAAAQSMAIDMSRVADGEHRVSITARCGEDETTAELHFRTAVFVPHGGGTVQELQDETGAPVFPLTLAKAALLTDGRSAESFMRDMDERVLAAEQQAHKVELLWENASPTSSFGAQTVKVDLSGYETVAVRFRTAGYYGTEIVAIDTKGRAFKEYITKYSGDSSYMIYHAYREFTTSATGVSFATGYRYRNDNANTGNSSTATTDNAAHIPQQIIGMTFSKGVSV